VNHDSAHQFFGLVSVFLHYFKLLHTTFFSVNALGVSIKLTLKLLPKPSYCKKSNFYIDVAYDFEKNTYKLRSQCSYCRSAVGSPKEVTSLREVATPKQDLQRFSTPCQLTTFHKHSNFDCVPCFSSDIEQTLHLNAKLSNVT